MWWRRTAAIGYSWISPPWSWTRFARSSRSRGGDGREAARGDFNAETAETYLASRRSLPPRRAADRRMLTVLDRLVGNRRAGGPNDENDVPFTRLAGLLSALDRLREPGCRPGWIGALQATLRVVPRCWNRPRSEPRSLRAKSAEDILAALESGAMLSIVAARTGAERRAVAEFAAGKPFVQPFSTTPSPQSMCRLNAGGFGNPLSGPRWNGWGVNTANTRYQDGSMAGVRREGHSTLEGQVGFRVPRRAERGCAANDGRRPCVCRFAKRHGLRFERRHRLYPLALSSRFRRTGCRNHRQHRDELRPAVRGFHWRPIRQRLRRRCRDWNASVDNEGG